MNPARTWRDVRSPARTAARRPVVRLTGAAVLVCGAVAVFLASAAVGVWAAYDRGPATRKFALLAAGVAIALLVPTLARLDSRRVPRLAWVACVPLTFGIALLGLASQSRPEERDAAAGALAIVLPILAGGLGRLRERLRRFEPLAVVASVSLALGLLAVARSGEGAAWLGLAGAVLYAAWAGGRGRPGVSWRHHLAGGLLATLAFGLVVAPVIGGPPSAGLPRLPPPVWSRIGLWHDAQAIIGDYVFTGSGLACSGMVLSSYAWLLHVPFTDHVHHLFLQIALEQGILGVSAFGIVLGTAVWFVRPGQPHSDRQHGRVATGASLVALIFCGLTESDLYASPLVPVLFLPVGFGWMFCAVSPHQAASRWNLRTRRIGIAVVSAATLAATFWGTRTAQFQANLGAVSQARAELSVYRWPQWGIQDQVRRNPAVDLEPAFAHYRAALVGDPGNVTALRRLGQIELSRGNRDSARALLTRAYAVAPRQRATRQMLGELAALDGDIERAARLWSTVENDRGQLDGRRWWYEQVGTAEEQQRIREAIGRSTALRSAR